MPFPFCFAPRLLKGDDEFVLLCPLVSQCFSERKSEESIEGAMIVELGEDRRAQERFNDEREITWELQQYYQHRGSPCKPTPLGIWN